MQFERQTVHETWRTPQCTFDVFFLTVDTVCIKGLRGNVSVRDYVAIAAVLSRENIKKIIYERKENGVFVERIITLKERFKK